MHKITTIKKQKCDYFWLYIVKYLNKIVYILLYIYLY